MITTQRFRPFVKSHDFASDSLRTSKSRTFDQSRSTPFVKSRAFTPSDLQTCKTQVFASKPRISTPSKIRDLTRISAPKRTRILFLFLTSLIFASLLSFHPVTEAYTLPDTGQTKCYDNSKEIPCPSPGQDFYGQDAQYQGAQPAYKDNGDGTVTDLNTGLMWQQGDGQNNFKRKWQEAVDYCANLDLGGRTDWRLPTIRELLSITNYTRYNPTIDISYFQDCRPDYYWSSTYVGPTCYDGFTHCAWTWSFLDSTQSQGGINRWQATHYVRCVRGQPLPISVYTDNGDGTITNITYGLMWPKRSDYWHSWGGSSGSALGYCENLTLGGHSDWRLPNILELQSLISNYSNDFNRDEPAWDPLFSLSGAGHWSSTTFVADPSQKWAVSLFYGESFPEGYNGQAVVCVRNTPPEPTQLTITLDSPQCGKVTGQGIDCGGDCEESYNQGTSITLTATPAEGYVLKYWTDGASQYTDNPVTITIDSDKNLTARFVTDKTPVLVIPGIMGSMSECLFDPVCCNPKKCPKKCNKDWGPWPVAVHLSCSWVLDPINVVGHSPTYASLKQAFEGAGYKQNVTLFEVPYDWRKENQYTASNILGSQIKEAKRNSPQGQVDIVAHSMGGLVARYYVEKMDRRDVRKFVMLGTPNQGSAKSYYPWEGGDFSVYGFFQREAFIEPMLEDMKTAYHYVSQPDYEFIQEFIPSLRQLLPTSTYLMEILSDHEIPISEMVWKNDLIPRLSSSKLRRNIRHIQIYAGTEIDNTIQKIHVSTDAPVTLADPWVDGDPYDDENDHYGTDYSSGDGTVLIESAKLGKIPVCEKSGVEHGELPDACRQEVVNYITGQGQECQEVSQPSAVKQLSYRPVAQSLLFLGTRDKIFMGIIVPQGQRAGRFSDDLTGAGKLEDYYYRGDDEQTAALGIYNAREGQYLLTVTTAEAKSNYDIYISYSKKTTKTKERLELHGTVTRGEARNHIIKINEKLEAY